MHSKQKFQIKLCLSTKGKEKKKQVFLGKSKLTVNKKKMIRNAQSNLNIPRETELKDPMA